MYGGAHQPLRMRPGKKRGKSNIDNIKLRPLEQASFSWSPSTPLILPCLRVRIRFQLILGMQKTMLISLFE